jgi:hypothetical protein
MYQNQKGVEQKDSTPNLPAGWKFLVIFILVVSPALQRFAVAAFVFHFVQNEDLWS